MNGNQFQNPYNNYSGLNVVSPPMPPQKHDIIQVNGEGGAKAFSMAPNSRALLLDTTSPIIWVKQTDGAGYPTLQAYSIEPIQTQPEESPTLEILKKLEGKITQIEEKIGGIENGRESNLNQQPSTAMASNLSGANGTAIQ